MAHGAVPAGPSYQGDRGGNECDREGPMPTTTRRDLLLSAAAASAAFGLDGRLSVPAAAAARPLHHPHQKTPDPPRGYARYTVGEAEITAVYDGIWEKAHDS